MLNPLFSRCFAAAAFLASAAVLPFASAADWLHWRGPLQNGASLEDYDAMNFSDAPTWSVDLPGQGTPLIIDGKVYAFGYRGEFDDLVETLTCIDEKTGKLLWENKYRDFISDTAYNRYAIGSPAYDAETKSLYLQTTNGLFVCVDAATGKLKWEKSLMETIGRLTFPNGRTGAPIIEGSTVIVHCITANWGGAGPANDRFYAYDKVSGDLVWFTSTGVQPKDSSHSTPYVETRYGKRVMYCGTGDGNLTAINARTGELLFRYQLSKMGVGASLVADGGVLMGIHNDENVDNSESGRMVGITLPETIPAKRPDPTLTDATPLPLSSEAWRHPVGSFTSSPTVYEGIVYQTQNTGNMAAVEIKTGKLLWNKKLAEDNLHSSPLAVDGYVIVPVKGTKVEGGAGYESFVYAMKAGTPTEPELAHTWKLKGEANGQPAVANGNLYVHTREKLYCFRLAKGEEIKVKPSAKEEPLVAGKAVALQPVPQEVLLSPGQKASFKLNLIDANGLIVGEAKEAKWESYIPPTAKVKATADAAFQGADLVAGQKMSAGAFKATTADGLSGVIRCRVMPSLEKLNQDFESFQITEDQVQEQAKFAYPPLPWMGARFKWDVREHDGSKMLTKTLDQIFFQRAMTFLGKEDASNYTLTADVMTDGSRRLKSEVGLVNQRYLITLKGNDNAISISSNYERLNKQTPFPVKANQWYTLKTKVDLNGTTAIIHAKAWERGTPEPEKWTFELEHKDGHTHGAPGVFGFSPQVQKRVFIDNITVVPNK